MVQAAKKLVAEKGIFPSPNVKQGQVPPPTTAKIVKQFYVSDEIGRSMQEQKIMFLLTLKARRFISGNDRYRANLKKAYVSFKELNTEKFLCFPNAAELQPRHYLLPAASAPPRVRVCVRARACVRACVCVPFIRT
jgi:hypothetical protein